MSVLLEPRFWKAHLQGIRAPAPSPLSTVRALQNVPLELGLEQGRYMDAGVWEHCMRTMRWIREGVAVIHGVEVAMRYASASRRRCVQEGAFYLRLCERFVSALAMARPLQPAGLRVTLIDCPLRKVYKAGATQLTSGSVNSGVTFRYGGRADVFVYRREEMVKVMLHELIHGMQLDSHGFPDALEAPFKAMFGVRNTLRINETYTDALACYLNVLVCTALGVGHRKDLMRAEKEHICSQAMHAMRFYGDWDARGQWRPRPEGIEEATHGVAYYILKGMLYMNVPALRRFFKERGCVLRGSADEEAFATLILQQAPAAIWTWHHKPPARYAEMLKARSMRMSRTSVK